MLKISYSKTTAFIISSIFILTNIVFSQHDLQIYNCAHSHICCQVGCNCCREQFRIQEFHSVNLENVHHTQRKIIADKFQYAKQSNKYPVRIQFYDPSKSSDQPITYFIPQLYMYAENPLFKSELNEILEIFEKTDELLVLDNEGN